jgi:hypothetical protein
MKICYIEKKSLGKFYCLVSEQQLIGIKNRKKRPRHSHFLCKKIDNKEIDLDVYDDLFGERNGNDQNEFNIIGEFVFADKSDNEGSLYQKLIPDNEDVLKEIMVIAPDLLNEVRMPGLHDQGI